MTIVIEIVASTFLVSLILYGVLFFMAQIFFEIKYPNMHYRLPKKNLLGSYFRTKEEYQAIYDKLEYIEMKVLPIISFVIGFIYSLYSMLEYHKII